jgi:hypothetical protein
MSLVNETGIFKIYDRFGNLFPLSCKIGKLYQKSMLTNDKSDEKTIFFGGNYFSYEKGDESIEVQPTLEMTKRMIAKQFILKIKNAGYALSKGYVLYSKQDEVCHPHRDIFSIFDGFEFRFVIINDMLLLCVNPHLVIETNCSIKYLVDAGINSDKLKDFSVRYKRKEGGRIDGYLVETVAERECLLCKVKSYREFKEEVLPADVVFPEPKPELIQYFLELLGRNFDLVAKQRELSFLNSKTASKDRFYKTLEIVNELKKNIFPLNFGDWKIDLETTPIVVKL